MLSSLCHWVLLKCFDSAKLLLLLTELEMDLDLKHTPVRTRIWAQSYLRDLTLSCHLTLTLFAAVSLLWFSLERNWASAQVLEPGGEIALHSRSGYSLSPFLFFILFFVLLSTTVLPFAFSKLEAISDLNSHFQLWISSEVCLLVLFIHLIVKILRQRFYFFFFGVVLFIV